MDPLRPSQPAAVDPRARAVLAAATAPVLTGEAAARLNLRTARLSVGTATALTLLKLVAAVFTGSLSIVASLVDSVMDILASLVNYFAVRLAGRPADAEHAYGHGKAEGLAGLGQTVVIAVSGVFLLVEGVRRLISGRDIDRPDLGLAVMAVSTVASVWITWRLRSAARRTGSLALAADSIHYASDVWTNLGVFVALAALRIADWHWIDGAVAAAVAVVVLGTAFHVLRRSTAELMDRALPAEAVARLLAAIRTEVPETRGLHDLRTRRAGPTVFVDCHVQFDRALDFPAAHLLSERVRIAIEHTYPGAYVTVHADPYPLLEADLEFSKPGHGADGVR